MTKGVLLPLHVEPPKTPTKKQEHRVKSPPSIKEERLHLGVTIRRERSASPFFLSAAARKLKFDGQENKAPMEVDPPSLQSSQQVKAQKRLRFLSSQLALIDTNSVNKGEEPDQIPPPGCR